MPSVTRKGVRVHFEVEGEGPPLVCHPSLGFYFVKGTMSDWMNSLPPHRWILVDPRGYGSSNKPAEVDAYRIEEYRDDVIAVLDEMAVSKAVYVGFSVGGQLGYALVEAHPERFSALIDYDGIDGLELALARKGDLELADLIRQMGWQAVVRGIAESDGVRDPRILRVLSEADSQAVANQMEAWSRRELYPFDLLQSLRVPVLVLLNGRRETQEVERMRSRAGVNREIRSIPGTSHGTLVFEPQHSVTLVRQFLERIEA